MSKSAPRVLLAASAFLLGSTALYAADMPVKAVPLPVAFSWAGAYVGGHAGASWDRIGVDQVQLSSPGFFASDPGGLVTGFPSFLLGVPGSFPTPANKLESGSGVSGIFGAQLGYNWQTGNIVYGAEADLQFINSHKSVNGGLFEAIPFDNRFALVSVKGKHLRRLVTSNLQRGGGILSWSGLTAKARCKDGQLAAAEIANSGIISIE